MNRKFAEVFVGTLAFILLLLYAITVAYMVSAVIRAGKVDPAEALPFTGGLVFVVTTIGGLVSALVVATLAVTQPGESPSIRAVTAGDGGVQHGSDVWLSKTYLIVWLVVGLGALVVGVMLYPDVNQTLKDIGTTWIGLAVASVLAYFRIEPKT